MLYFAYFPGAVISPKPGSLKFTLTFFSFKYKRKVGLLLLDFQVITFKYSSSDYPGRAYSWSWFSVLQLLSGLVTLRYSQCFQLTTHSKPWLHFGMLDFFTLWHPPLCWFLQEAEWHSRHREWIKKRRFALLLVSSRRPASLLSAHSRGGPPDHPQSSVQVHRTVHLHHWAPQLTGHCLPHQDIAHV